MNYLAIDYGLKHVGLAYSAGFLAEPLTQITNTSDDVVIAKILELCEHHQIDTLVMGLSEGEMAEITREFSRKLSEVLDCEIVFQDETLSSQIAVKKMVSGGSGKKKRQEKQHQVAAAVILQDYLDTL